MQAKKLRVKKFIQMLGGAGRIARYFGISYQAIRKWVSEDKIPVDRLLPLAAEAERMGVATREQILPPEMLQAVTQLVDFSINNHINNLKNN